MRLLRENHHITGFVDTRSQVLFPAPDAPAVVKHLGPVVVIIIREIATHPSKCFVEGIGRRRFAILSRCPLYPVGWTRIREGPWRCRHIKMEGTWVPNDPARKASPCFVFFFSAQRSEASVPFLCNRDRNVRFSHRFWSFLIVSIALYSDCYNTIELFSY